MAASIDKETLIKQHFWILAGCFLILVLIPLLVLVTSVSATVEKEEKDLKDAKDSVKRITDPKNEEWVKAFQKQDEQIDGKKNTIWQAAWDHRAGSTSQKDMMTWPQALAKQGWGRTKYRYFGDPIDFHDATKFDSRDSGYETQVAEVYHIMQPLMRDKRGKPQGVVQFGGDWNGILQLYPTFKAPASREDIWLAQEDLWVKRELLRVIRDANDAVAKFKEVEPESAADKDNKDAKPATDKDKTAAAAAADKDKPVAPKAAGDLNHKLFRNPYWELDLTLAKNEKGRYVLRGTIKNTSKRRQPLDTDFKVFLQAGDDPERAFHELHLADEPLPVGKSLAIKDSLLSDQLTIEGLYGVEQVLTWKTGPVKRLDQLALRYPSSRTATRTLKRPLWAEKPPDATAGAPGAAGDSSGGVPSPSVAGGGTPDGGGKKSMMAGGGGGGRDGAVSKSGLELNRYTDVNEQVRHMPVGLVVIVEEDHIPDLLAAFTNSVLRIQTTQYHWQHCRDKISPMMADEPVLASGSRPGGFTPPSISKGFGNRPGPGAGSDLGTSGSSGFAMRGKRSSPGFVPPPGAPGRKMGERGEGRGGTGDGTGEGPSGPLGFGPPTGDPEAEEEMNLVEVAVYGIASLYERPGKPKPENTEANTAAADASKAEPKK